MIDIYYKKLAHGALEAEKSQDLQVRQQAGDPGRADVPIQVRRQEETDVPAEQSGRRSSLSLEEGLRFRSRQTFT